MRIRKLMISFIDYKLTHAYTISALVRCSATSQSFREDPVSFVNKKGIGYEQSFSRKPTAYTSIFQLGVATFCISAAVPAS
jgi:hypothetical protein